MSKKYTEKAKDYFKRHPSSNECHITTDGRVFHTLGSAQGFAGTQEDQTIESYKRTVLEKEVKEVINDDETEKETKLAELASLELVSSNYQEMKALVKFFDLKPIDQKAETLITALTEFKTTLNQ